MIDAPSCDYADSCKQLVRADIQERLYISERTLDTKQILHQADWCVSPEYVCV
jgi:hypothetical protein